MNFVERFRPVAAFAVIFSIFLLSLPSFGQTKYRPSQKSEKWADKMLKKMTVDEKLGQLIHVGINAKYLNQDHPDFIELKRQVVENKVGGIIVFIGGMYESLHLVNRMQEAAKIPLLISADFETGISMRFEEATPFPWNMAIAATGKPEFAKKQGAIIGREAKAMGVQFVFGPVVDVNNNSKNPVINIRSYGEDPTKVAEFGMALTEGIQSQNVIATAKHFPGHGDTAVDSHRGLPIIDHTREQLESTELVPFKKLIDGGVGSVMVGHIALPKIDPTAVKPLKQSINLDTDSAFSTENGTMPASLSPVMINGLLKTDMKFDGLVVTDALSMSGLTQYFNQDEIAVRSLLAGSDILLKPADVDIALAGLKKAYSEGKIPDEILNKAVRKQLAWKHQVGLADKKITPVESVDTIVSGKETRALADEIAKNAVTLIKNDNAALPLTSGKRVLVLCMTNGEDRLIVGNALTSKLAANGIRAERVVLDERSSPEEKTNAMIRMSKADIVLAAFFCRVRSGAKNSLDIPKAGEEALKAAFAAGKPTVGISFGNPYILNSFPELNAYAVTYGDMQTLQRAAADAATGKTDFYGRLPITIGDHKIGTGLSLNK